MPYRKRERQRENGRDLERVRLRLGQCVHPVTCRPQGWALALSGFCVVGTCGMTHPFRLSPAIRQHRRARREGPGFVWSMIDDDDDDDDRATRSSQRTVRALAGTIVAARVRMIHTPRACVCVCRRGRATVAGDRERTRHFSLNLSAVLNGSHFSFAAV